LLRNWRSFTLERARRARFGPLVHCREIQSLRFNFFTAIVAARWSVNDPTLLLPSAERYYSYWALIARSMASCNTLCPQWFGKPATIRAPTPARAQQNSGR